MQEHPIVFYDGSCGLCNRAVRFIIRHDRRGKIRFATLQSGLGEKARAEVQRRGWPSDSVIFFEGGEYYTESAAVLRIAAWLDGGWSWLRFLHIVPAFLRDAAYRFVSKHRYQWFGKQAQCALPTPEWRSRFID
jgi:predicted DCC family thiol-disulfide oxidoreductase YuxK